MADGHLHIYGTGIWAVEYASLGTPWSGRVVALDNGQSPVLFGARKRADNFARNLSESHIYRYRPVKVDGKAFTIDRDEEGPFMRMVGS